MRSYETLPKKHLGALVPAHRVSLLGLLRTFRPQPRR